MDDKFSRIQKPLAIIAIFAGIVQISGIAVLPYIDSPQQSKLTWFLISFPVLMVLLFFITINYYIRVTLKSSKYLKLPKPGKTIRPVTRYEVEQKKKDDVNLTARRKTVFDTESYTNNIGTKSDIREEAGFTGEKYKRITRASEDKINWK
jgi:hypothetical protein